MKISACLITYNEEHNLPRCLESLKHVADEIVIVDSGSSDRTNFIATDYNARFIRHEWEGFVGQKNFAINKASCDWILSIDADEALSPELQQAIQVLKGSSTIPEASGYEMSRVVFYQNTWIRFGDWYPDRLVRLFQKNSARFDGGSVHEQLDVDGLIKGIDGELHHYSFKDEQDYLDRMEHYSTLWAQQKQEESLSCNALSPILHGSWKLIRSFLIKNGWKGGALGWRLAQLQAKEVFLKYRKLLRLANN
ncbi:MAG: glycosyltransferase family 2 protein [Verrucomicrobiota bacterium]